MSPMGGPLRSPKMSPLAGPQKVDCPRASLAAAQSPILRAADPNVPIILPVSPAKGPESPTLRLRTSTETTVHFAVNTPEIWSSSPPASMAHFPMLPQANFAAHQYYAQWRNHGYEPPLPGAMLGSWQEHEQYPEVDTKGLEDLELVYLYGGHEDSYGAAANMYATAIADKENVNRNTSYSSFKCEAAQLNLQESISNPTMTRTRSQSPQRLSLEPVATPRSKEYSYAAAGYHNSSDQEKVDLPLTPVRTGMRPDPVAPTPLSSSSHSQSSAGINSKVKELLFKNRQEAGKPSAAPNAPSASGNGTGENNKNHHSNNAKEGVNKEGYGKQNDKKKSAKDENQGGTTTLMFRNIPNKYTREMLLKEIKQKGFHGKYDFFYLPIDFRNRCNVGYAFINFVTPQDAERFKYAFQGQQLKAFNSAKVCEITPAKVQGKDANVEQYRNSAVMHQEEKYHPLVFDNRVRVSFPEPTSGVKPFRPRNNDNKNQFTRNYHGDSCEPLNTF